MTSSLITINLNVFLETARSKFLTSKDSFFPKTECQGLHLMCRPQCWLKGYDPSTSQLSALCPRLLELCCPGPHFWCSKAHSWILSLEIMESYRQHLYDLIQKIIILRSISILLRWICIHRYPKICHLSCHNLARRWGELRQFTA